MRELVTRSAGRHVVIEAVGERALLTVIGDEGLDMTGLGSELRDAVERLATVLRGDTPA
ncbi:hypothetical protein GTY41_18055 [Streptomyces sp. SID685]|uniref:hypothetical protein n=1 Tax=Streptomyces TaxID=1883 RepID=UPI00136D34CE|nr:hypothetical protein [Streptomyces sp. SID685]MYR86794.1 hypothetical protein [Streptomyces sp. SID685]